MSWKETLKVLEDISNDKKISVEKREKAKKLLKSKKEFFKFYVISIEVKEKEDIVKAFEQRMENNKKSVLKNPQITEQNKEKLLKNLEKDEKKMKKEIKEIIEWSKK